VSTYQHISDYPRPLSLGDMNDLAQIWYLQENFSRITLYRSIENFYVNEKKEYSSYLWTIYVDSFVFINFSYSNLKLLTKFHVSAFEYVRRRPIVKPPT